VNEMLRNNHATFCTIPLKSETNDDPASTIEQLSVPDNGPAITTSCFLQLPNDSPAKQPPDPHNDPASFMSIFLSQLRIVPTSNFLHIHVPKNATIAHVSATTATTNATMTQVSTTRSATTNAPKYQLDKCNAT
jgi:hypothetical protein